jgi:hypothetical protein
VRFNLIESADSMLAEEALTEAERQFAAAEITDGFMAWGFERGGWHMLLLWAQLTYVAPYCAKLIGPCPDGCATVQLTGCGGGTAGDCWRVKQPGDMQRQSEAVQVVGAKLARQ